MDAQKQPGLNGIGRRLRFPLALFVPCPLATAQLAQSTAVQDTVLRRNNAIDQLNDTRRMRCHVLVMGGDHQGALSFFPERAEQIHDRGTRVPTRRTRSFCCARAASGHAAATPPRAPRNSRRRMFVPKLGTR